MPSPNSAPYEWYDLLAEDAIQNVAKYNLNLDVEKPRRSQRETPEQEDPPLDPQLRSPNQDLDEQLESPFSYAASPIQGQRLPSLVQDHWNSTEIIPLTGDELVLFQHYVTVVGPILDICDTRQFSTTVPRLSVHNLGLLKSLLAVAARHLASLNQPSLLQPSRDSHIVNPLLNVARQYYYETLQYLSQNLNQGSYSKSREIIATALLISTYEMFDAEGQYNNGAWERHLRGIFWIQRSQNNNGYVCSTEKERGRELPSIQSHTHQDERTTDASPGNAKIRSEEQPGGPGYVKILGWLSEKAAGC